MPRETAERASKPKLAESLNQRTNRFLAALSRALEALVLLDARLERDKTGGHCEFEGDRAVLKAAMTQLQGLRRSATDRIVPF